MKEEQIWLAALLHDIGKFYQRTKVKPPGKNDDGVTGDDAKWSSQFIDIYVPAKWRDGLSTFLNNHKPSDLASMIVAAADRLSAGAPQNICQKGDSATKPMINIFSRLKSSSRIEYIPLVSLSLTEATCFPVKDKTKALNANSYSDLWQNFSNELAKAGTVDEFAQYYNQLSALLEKYTTAVPSAAYQSEPDISLYHHAKSSAAIAACLAKTIKDEKTADQILQAANGQAVYAESICTLVGGDISGIQDFIYSVGSVGALRSLKGRSFYLQLMAEGLARWILEQEGLPLSNLVFCGGGHFYLMLPADSEVGTRLASYRSKMDQQLFEAHRGKLAVALHWIPLTISDFNIKVFGLCWKRLKEHLGQEKKRIYQDIIRTKFPEIMGPYELGGEHASCEVCGHELDSDTAGTCADCKSFEELGAKLADAHGLTFDKRPAASGWQRVLSGLGMTPWILRKDEAEACTTPWWLFNNTDIAGRKCCHGFLQLARHVARGSLEEIAGRATGIKKWGILRADVDNLGRVFTDGLGDDRTFSRVSMLSYQLGYFFNSWVDWLVSQEKYRNSAYVIYSGGDDLSILGPWSILLDLAMDIRKEFSKFTSDALDMSAGIYLAPSAKFPVYQAAKEAGELVELAKQAGKGRLAIFDRSITWDEFGKLKKISSDIALLFQQSANVPRSLLSILYSSWEDQKDSGQVSMNRIWRLFYAFGRLKERMKKDEEALSQLTILEQEIMVNQNTALCDNLDVAVRWAEYLTRGEGEKR